MNEWVRLIFGVLLLTAVAVGVLTAAQVPQRRAAMSAVARAAIQLAVVAAALRGVFAAPVAVVAALGVMFSVAAWTSARRLAGHESVGHWVAVSILAGSAVTVGIIIGGGVLDRNVRTLVAVSGIVLGGTMTAATLTGRGIAEGIRRRRDEVEAWLALGATSRMAVRDIARHATGEALVPALDQTRTVGLVTLPGAFVGAILGGASATDAARFQIVVLAGLLCAEVITATALAWFLGAPRVLPEAS